VGRRGLHRSGLGEAAGGAEEKASLLVIDLVTGLGHEGRNLKGKTGREPQGKGR